MLALSRQVPVVARRAAALSTAVQKKALMGVGDSFVAPQDAPPVGPETFQPFKHIEYRTDGATEFDELVSAYGRAERDTPLKAAQYVDEKVSNHRSIVKVGGHEPVVSADAFVAPCAVVSGDVKVGPKSSVFYSCVVRGDTEPVSVGAFTNIQDHSCISPDSLSTSDNKGTTIGDFVTIGHSVKMMSCTIESHTLIGMGAALMGGSVVESYSIVAPNAVVPRGARVPSGQLWAGRPARYIRDLSEAERAFMAKGAESYSVVADEHKDEFYLPYNIAASHDMEKVQRQERHEAAAEQRRAEEQQQKEQQELEAYLAAKGK